MNTTPTATFRLVVTCDDCGIDCEEQTNEIDHWCSNCDAIYAFTGDLCCDDVTYEGHNYVEYEDGTDGYRGRVTSLT